MRIVTYVTDIEGIGKKLDTFVRESPWLTTDTHGRIDVHSDAIFVFGGDAIDRGPDGRRVVETLLDAKARQPERVVLIAGNRDINKIRLPRELSGRPPRWVPDELKRGPRADLLRAIFANSMGARGAFDFRKEELAGTGAPSTDDDVVQSFVDDLAPGGPMFRFLEASQLAFRFGSTLFVHGAVTDESLGNIPGEDREPDIDRWVERLNAFYQSQIRAFGADPIDASDSRPYAPLIRYQAPLPNSGHNPESVVYGRCVDPENNPVLPERGVVARLARAGIHRLVVGHTPSGDTPSVLRAEGFEMISADNSYGSLDWGAGVDIDDGNTRVTIRGQATLETGEVVSVGFTTEGREMPALGQRDKRTGLLVKGPIADSRALLFKYEAGLALVQRAVAAQDVDALELEPPHRAP